MPPRPSSLMTAYAPIRSPIRSRSFRLSRAAANSANSSKTVVSWARSFSASRRSVVSSAHDSLSTAVCFSTDGCSNASARISLSRCQRAGSDLICVVIDTIVLYSHTSSNRLRSHNFAVAQSRFTVARDIFSVDAISSTERPAKNRSSTI